jgi:hypothetical protein
MFGYDYFNVGPNFDLNSLDSISECIQGVLDDYNSQTITYNQAAERLRTSACGGNSDNGIYDILITENPDAPNDDENAEPDCASQNRHVASLFSKGDCGGCLDGYKAGKDGNCYEYYEQLPPEGDEEVETQGETHIFPRNTERNLLVATVGILGLLVLWKK